jgi:hypothetical protein
VNLCFCENNREELRTPMMSQPQKRTSSAVPAIFSTLFALLGGCAASANKGAAVVDTKSTIEFPYAVSFEGVQDVFGRNALGDAIVITAVHGTAATIAIGNTYRIDGAYTLASREQATLSTSMTDTQPDEPYRRMIPGQSVKINKGSGTFTVYLKAEDPGCPHVSFYPSDGGESFAGEYFGTRGFLPPESWRIKTQVAVR